VKSSVFPQTSVACNVEQGNTLHTSGTFHPDFNASRPSMIAPSIGIPHCFATLLKKSRSGKINTDPITLSPQRLND
jgi:hypothetical protein